MIHTAVLRHPDNHRVLTAATYHNNISGDTLHHLAKHLVKNPLPDGPYGGRSNDYLTTRIATHNNADDRVHSEMVNHPSAFVRTQLVHAPNLDHSHIEQGQA
jgi:hypothetical protein